MRMLYGEKIAVDETSTAPRPDPNHEVPYFFFLKYSRP